MLTQGPSTAAMNGVSPPSVWRCTIVIAAVIASLRVLGFAGTLRATRRFGISRVPLEPGSSTSALARASARAIALAAALFPGRARCLEQSLALVVLLRRRGVAAEFKLGVQPYRFRAHAWVEVDGTPLNEDGELIQGMVALPEIQL